MPSATLRVVWAAEGRGAAGEAFPRGAWEREAVGFGEESPFFRVPLVACPPAHASPPGALVGKPPVATDRKGNPSRRFRRRVRDNVPAVRAPPARNHARIDRQVGRGTRG